MSHTTATWLAWSMCALSLALTAASLLLLALNLAHPDARGRRRGCDRLPARITATL